MERNKRTDGTRHRTRTIFAGLFVAALAVGAAVPTPLWSPRLVVGADPTPPSEPELTLVPRTLASPPSISGADSPTTAGPGIDPRTATAPHRRPRTAAPRTRVPMNMNLYRRDGFRFQDHDKTACTAASTMDMLNFIALAATGGPGFAWSVNLTDDMRDEILAWERDNDTMAKGSKGSDPHGWRNALNEYGWGPGALAAGSWVYEDVAFASFDAAVKAAVRQMIRTGKPVGMLGVKGRHAEMITGYWGLDGDPLARTSDGVPSDAFTIGGLYVSDPLKKHRMRNVSVAYDELATSKVPARHFVRYKEKDSPDHDPYAPGDAAARDEWVGSYVLILPVR